jgi:hypothetical protein
VLSHDQELLNTAVSRARIIVEHTIGMLKGRFPWLRSMRCCLTDDFESMQTILEFIDTAVILHNILLFELNDEISTEWFTTNQLVTAGDRLLNDSTHKLNTAVPATADKYCRRLQLTNYLVDNYVT